MECSQYESGIIAGPFLVGGGSSEADGDDKKT